MLGHEGDAQRWAAASKPLLPSCSSRPVLPAGAPGAAPANGATVPEATLALTKICIGSGVLALPWAVEQGGALSLPGLVALG